MRVTSAELAGLKRKREQPARTEGELLAIFVPGRLLNPLNASAWVWQKRSRYAKQWRERVADALWDVAGQRDHMTTGAIVLSPKRVKFLASTHNRMDSDGLQAALKPIRDALIECQVITGDADKDGNVFEYDQKIDRTRRGVEIRVEAI